MSSKALQPSTRTLYDEDFVRWTAETARLLRERRFDQIDVENLAEETEDLGKRDRRELESRLRILLGHLLKWKWQPGNQSGSWRATITTQRAEMASLFQDSPSLRAKLPRSIEQAYPSARQLAADETALSIETLPARCPFSPDQILDSSFLPE